MPRDQSVCLDRPAYPDQDPIPLATAMEAFRFAFLTRQRRVRMQLVAAARREIEMARVHVCLGCQAPVSEASPPACSACRGARRALHNLECLLDRFELAERQGQAQWTASVPPTIPLATSATRQELTTRQRVSVFPVREARPVTAASDHF